MQNQNENTTSQISKENHEQSEQIIPFCKLPVGDYYYMYNVQPLKTKYGQISYFAEFRRAGDCMGCKDFEVYKAWIPDSLLEDFRELGVEDCIMLNKGRRRSRLLGSCYVYWNTKVYKIDYEDMKM